MNLANVMQEIADQLDTIDGLRAYGWPLDAPPQPPAAIITYPGSYLFDATYGRGMDTIPDLAVVVLVGRVSDRTTRERLGAYCDGSGPRSVKEVVEAGSYTAFDTVRVAGVEFDSYEQGGNPYMTATFTLDIAGQGA